MERYSESELGDSSLARLEEATRDQMPGFVPCRSKSGGVKGTQCSSASFPPKK
jgi:hypothetical protein